jgi:hypothetical protein
MIDRPRPEAAPPRAMPEPEAVAVSLCAALAGAKTIATPFPHHLLDGILPRGVAESVAALPIASAEIGETAGKRETHNSLRVFFDPGTQARHPVCAAIAAAFQREAAIEAIEGRCGTSLTGSHLRIEYCQDRDGFWLEPHTDIGAKRVTLLIYLSSDPGLADCGTDIYDASRRRVGRAAYRANSGLAFVPASDTWHGFQKRPIAGIRKSLIVNYVDPAWRSRHELSFPDRPVEPRRQPA